MKACLPRFWRGVLGRRVASAEVNSCDFVGHVLGVWRGIDEGSRGQIGRNSCMGEYGRERKAEGEDFMFCKEVGCKSVLVK